ncbi:MAG: FG-GAP-like repeat-containing protein, partial [Candidatus Zixiibacteriota bacterium]
APGVFNIPIYSIETTKDSSLYLIPIDMEEGEYFLLECRNPYSSGQFDKVDSDFSCYFWPDLAYGGDPLDGGLLITHVHDSLGAYYWRINNGTPEYPHYTVAVEDAGYALGTAENPEGGLTDSAQWWYPYETRRAAPFNPDPSLYPMPQNEFAEYTNPSSDGYYGPTGIIVRVDSVGDDRLYAYIYNPLGASVAYTSPTQNELNVPVSTNISVTFDIDMDWATINDSTFVVNAWSTGLHQGTLAYEGATKTAAFDPSEDFAVGEIVTVVLTTDMKTASGFPLDGSYAWSFTTEVSDESTGTFSLPTNWEAGDRAISVFSADLDGDTDLDLAVANYNSYNVSILKNNGDGAFETRVDYTTGDSPVSVFCADLDGDTDLDLAVANANSDNVSILMNNGDGTFQTGVDYEAGYAPWYVFCADLDGDTHLDLAVINSLSKVSIFKNNGDGTFQTKVDYSTGSSPNSVFCADLDGDYDLDLVVPNSYIDSISILKNNGDGTFQARVDYAAGNGPLHVFCADLDGDTDLDLAVPNGYSDDVSILKNNGDGTFETNVDYITGDNPVSVFCADLDGDTHLDLALTNMGDDNVSILKNNGDGTFQAKVDYAAGEGPTSVFCADLDGDTDLDLAVANYNSDNVSILKNLTGPYFIRGDANGDGIINVGDIVYLVSYLYKSGPAPSPVEVGDCNCDGIVNVGDVVYLVSYLYKNGPPPGC